MKLIAPFCTAILSFGVSIGLLFQYSNAFAQSNRKQYALEIPLGQGKSLVFLTKEKGSGLYREPRIKGYNFLSRIEGYDSQNFSSNWIKRSPDGSHLVMEGIIKGYVYSGEKDSVLHENYGCVIVDIKRARVVQYLTADCDGSWNKSNEWISNGRVVYSSSSMAAADNELPLLGSSNIAHWLHSLKLSGPRNFGSKVILNHFPRSWKLSGYDNQKSPVDLYTRYIDSMNYQLYYQADAPGAIPFLADSSLMAKFFPDNVRKGFHLQPFSDTTIFGAQLLNRGSSISLYSIKAKGKVSCNGCETDTYQTIEIWLTTSDSEIIDVVLVACETGDDIVKQMRYYFYDQKQTLYLKDFTIRELSVTHDGQQQWKIGPTNRMTKIR